MRLRLVLAVLAGTVAFSQPAGAQVTNDDVGGIPTETQDRIRAGDQTTDALNWLGLIGLIGLWGLRRGHEEDSYHPSDIE
jgi:MYXO-CTERM domain-containing protein